jgi:hypothetical protein
LRQKRQLPPTSDLKLLATVLAFGCGQGPALGDLERKEPDGEGWETASGKPQKAEGDGQKTGGYSMNPADLWSTGKDDDLVKSPVRFPTF